MGLRFFSRAGESPLPNPNPENWEILSAEQISDYLIVKIKYPDCNNYEGEKILVYHGVTLKQLKSQKCLDPHFSDRKDGIYPIARFSPTSTRGDGFANARSFVVAMINKYNEE